MDCIVQKMKNHIFKRFITETKGTSAIEFAFLAPILIFMIIGTLDAGIFIQQKMQLHNAVSSAANYAAQTGEIDNIDTVAAESYDGDINNITLVSEFECECSDGSVTTCPRYCGMNDFQRRFISVSAEGTFSPMFVYPGIPDSIDLSTNVRVRVD